jgi:hypothetical protein
MGDREGEGGAGQARNHEPRSVTGHLVDLVVDLVALLPFAPTSSLSEYAGSGVDARNAGLVSTAVQH